ncbi:MAG: hypothetical protein AAF702_52015 [Chloroflexota bacterium]
MTSIQRNEYSSFNETEPPPVTEIIVRFILLIFAWTVLFYWMLGLTEGLLVPWDIHPGRPPLGTWSRAVNDFFETPPGSWLPATLVWLINLILLLYRLLSRPESFLFLEFAAISFLFIILDLLLIMIVTVILNLTGIDIVTINFYHKIPGIICTVALLGLLFWGKWSGVLNGYLRHKLS